MVVHSRYVNTPGEARPGGPRHLFRVRDGMIVDHWDTMRDVPETSADDNTTF